MGPRPVYDEHLMMIANALRAGPRLVADLQLETDLSRHYVLRCLQYLAKTGCVTMHRTAVSARGWKGVYFLTGEPVLTGDKRRPRGPGKSPEEVSAPRDPGLALWLAWPVNVSR